MRWIVMVVATLAGCGRFGFDAVGGGDGGSDDAIVAVTECNDGIDNDGDGLTDWTFDLGCYGPIDPTEAAGARADEAGWSTFDTSTGQRILYVSSSTGSDVNDGLSPAAPLATINAGVAKLGTGRADWLLLRRGDRWRETISLDGRSGVDKLHPMIVGSYGESTERPVILTGANDGLRMSGSNVAILDLDFYADTRDPASPNFATSSTGIGVTCGGGTNVLIEGSLFRFSESAIVQSQGLPTNVEIRRNVMTQTYAGGGMGVYAYRMDGLLIEENVFDHNGWNEDAPNGNAGAGASTVNLDSNQNVTVRGNMFLRAGSQMVRFASNAPNGFLHAVVEDNLFVEGEIAVVTTGGAGGMYRYGDLTIRNNVGLSIGATRPTGRGLSWGVYLCDVGGASVTGNLFLYQVANTNAAAFQVLCSSARDITIEHNLTYEQGGAHVTVQAMTGFSLIRVANNLFENSTLSSYLVTQTGGFTGFTYADNHYQTAASANAWFLTNTSISLANWIGTSGETGATNGVVTHPDANGRTVAEYQTMLGRPATVAAFADDAIKQRKLAWRGDYTAAAFNAWVRAGFSLP